MFPHRKENGLSSLLCFATWMFLKKGNGKWFFAKRKLIVDLTDTRPMKT